MLGLDDRLAALAHGHSLSLVLLIAALLGLRHATDPDHLAAVSTLIAGGSERAARTAGRLGLAWGAGHATSLFVLGLPAVVAGRVLPERVLQASEVLIAAVIMLLALRVLVRWRRGRFHVHLHGHGEHLHAHLHAHDQPGARAHAHAHELRGRTSLGAFGIGLLHGVGGSAGVALLVLAAIPSPVHAVLALAVLAAFTAVSMALLSTAFGLALTSRLVQRGFAGLAPGLGLASLAFGGWYGAAALGLAPYPF